MSALPDLVPKLSARAWTVLAFLANWHPLPLPTKTVARAYFYTARSSAKTAQNKAQRCLASLRDLGLVLTKAVPTMSGRSPAFWHLTQAGLAAVAATGRMTEEELAQRSRSNKSYATLLRRRQHDLYVAECEAELRWLNTVHGGVMIEELCHDHRAWATFETPAGEEVTVAPDLVAKLVINGQELLVINETQGADSPLSRVEEKVQGFKAYLAAGHAAERYGTTNVRILFVTFSPAPDRGLDHRNNIVETCGAVGGLDRIVLCASLADLREQGITAPIWVRPVDLKGVIASLPPRQQERLTGARHKGNRTRWDRDEAIERARIARRLFS